jgi:hypothetical protein
MRSHWISLFIIFLLILSACADGPNDGIPAYIQIDSVSVNAKAGQGSSSHAINTLWIESEGENIGPFEMPVLAPALVSGNRELILNAGVFVRGDFFNREIYPAYQPYKVNLDFVPGQIQLINPTFEYYDETAFPLIEDFESGNAFGGLDRTDVNDPNNLEGKALWIVVDEATPLVKGVTSSPVSIPPLRRVYIEMDYKADTDFAIGIEGLQNGSISQDGYIDRFFASEDWTKIYYEISGIINAIDADNYNFYIEVLKLSNVPESNVYIDNFKIVVI